MFSLVHSGASDQPSSWSKPRKDELRRWNNEKKNDLRINLFGYESDEVSILYISEKENRDYNQPAFYK